jgi:hypothetical protein
VTVLVNFLETGLVQVGMAVRLVAMRVLVRMLDMVVVMGRVRVGVGLAVVLVLVLVGLLVDVLVSHRALQSRRRTTRC